MAREYGERIRSFADKEVYYDKESEDCYVTRGGVEILSVSLKEREENDLNISDLLRWSDYLEEESGDVPFTMARKRALKRVVDEKPAN